MHHRISGRQLGRHSQHRLAMMRNLSISLIEHHQIETTLAKAKELRKFLEPLITIAKVDSVAARRLLLSKLGPAKATVEKLLKELGPFYQKRPGGYTRVLKNGFRKGDAAPKAVIQLVDKPKVLKIKQTVDSQVPESIEGELVDEKS